MAGAIVPLAQTGLNIANVASIANSLGLGTDARRLFDYVRNNLRQSRERYSNLRKEIQKHATASRGSARPTPARGSKSSKMPRYTRKKPAYKRKAKKIRKADKMIKRAKKRRNYKVLSRIPRPIGGLEPRKVVRLIATENSYMHWVKPSTAILDGQIIAGGAQGAAAGTPVTLAPKYRTFCLNDIGSPMDSGTGRGGGWRPHFFIAGEDGDSTQPASMGHIPGWRTWAGFYKKAEVIGANVKVRFTNTTRDAAIQTPAVVGYNLSSDRTENGDALTIHQQLNNFGLAGNPDSNRKINTAEDLKRAKICSLKVVKPEAPGDVAHFRVKNSTRKQFPNVSGSNFMTSQTTATDLTANPGPIKNKTYMTLVGCPEPNAAGDYNYTIAYSVEIEFLVMYSEMQDTFKTTAQVMSGNYKAEIPAFA